MGTPGGHSEGCPSVLLPGPCREKKANLLSLFSQGGGMQEEEGGRERERETGGGRRVSEQEKMRHRERERERESVCVCMQRGVDQFSKQTA